MPKDLDLIAQGGQSVNLSAPGTMQRVVSVSIDFSVQPAGERVRLRFMTPDGGTLLSEVVSGPTLETDGRATFVLGGTCNPIAPGATIDNHVSGPLPDIWWDPDHQFRLECDGSSTTVAGWTILRQVRPLERQR